MNLEQAIERYERECTKCKEQQAVSEELGLVHDDCNGCVYGLSLAALRKELEREHQETLIPCDEMRTGIFNLIIAERARQDTLWGTPQENTFSEWAGILAEECGEASAELNELNFGRGNKERAIKELIEAAAVAVAAIEQYDVAEMVTAAWYAYRTTPEKEKEESL